MAWAPLKFTTPLQKEDSSGVDPAAPLFSSMDGADLGKATHLLGSCRAVLDGATELIDFVNTNRSMSKRIGIESIAVELSGILEGTRLGDVRNLLDSSIKKGRPVVISPDVTSKVRRAEILLADAAKEIKKEMGSGDSPTLAAGDSSTLAAAAGEGGIGYFWVPFAALGLVAAGIAIWAYKPPKKITSTLRKTAPKIGSRSFLGSSQKRR